MEGFKIVFPLMYFSLDNPFINKCFTTMPTVEIYIPTWIPFDEIKVHEIEVLHNYRLFPMGVVDILHVS